MRGALLRITYIIALLSGCLISNAQGNSTLTHYSTDDGLTENSILSMYQDKQGFMWFGSFSGLNRFDGYKFKTYKALAGDKNGLKSDKIEYITEDNYGFIWIRTNEGIIYRLDKRNDKFQPIPQSIKPFEKFFSELRNIKKMSNGNLWLVATNAGCFKVEIDPNDYSIRCKYFSVKNGLLASDSVNNVFEDSQHNVWILTKAGVTEVNPKGVIKHYFNNKSNALSFFKLINIDKKEDILTASHGKLIKYNKQNKRFKIIQLPTTSNLRDILPMRDKQYAIITENDGFFIYNYNNQFRHFSIKDSPYLNTQKLTGYVDKFNELWLNSESDGILHFDPKTKKIRKLTLNTDKIGSYLVRPRAQIFEDIHNNLWIYPRIGGFSLYNRKTRQLEYFHNSPEDPNRWFSNVIYSYCSDNQGNLWLSTFSQGIEKITFYPTTFSLFKPMPTSNGVTDNEVRALCEDCNGNLWVAMRSGVVLLFDKDRKRIGYLGKTGKLNEAAKFEALVYAILVDNKNNVWLGTKGDGLFLLKPQGNRKSYSISHFTEGKDKYSINSNIIYALNQDKNGRVWVGTFDGGLNYIDETNGSIRFINSNNDLKQWANKQFNRVRCITSNNNGLWVGTTSGLLYCNNTHTNPQNIRFQAYTRNLENPHSLSSNDICKILVTKKGQVLIGTIGGGLNILQTSANGTTFKSYNTGKNFPTDVILGMVEDKKGHVWISSENKLIKFEPQTSQFEVIGKNYGIEKTNFSESTALKLQHNGNVLFGCNNGIYYFNPSQIKHKTYTPPLVFTGFTLFNKDSVSATEAPLEYNINTSNAITLKYNQSVFTIEFSALDFRSPNNILYAYKLESGDKSEYIIQKQRSVTFTKLQPGDYVFKVKSTNSEGVWVNNEREVHITILPPFWKSGWAYFLYTLLVIGFVILSAYILFVIFKLQNKVKMEEKLTETKLQFFTEISHELRTPLTLISLPVENILNESALPTGIKEQLSLIKRNVDRMVRLVNQILEFRKIEETGIRLTIEETKLGLFVKDVCTYYADIAKQKSLNIVITDNSNEQTVFIDKDKVDKIIYNILSNAFKYSPSNSEIHISIYKEGERIYVSIQDEGPGLSDKIKNKIFKLYQSTGNDNDMQTGTGIGLAFSKKLANAHKATLELESIANKGTCVKIGFLLGTNHFEKEDLLQLRDVIDTNISNSTREQTQASIHADTTILVVEDNVELRQFMVNALQSNYHVVEASNGVEAIETGLNIIPDIIISDILMPQMDGLELARRIKEDINISHIPIILLTAKTDIESKLDALKKGVDDYITKPFSINYLEARIENLLKTREQLQSYFKSTLSNGTITLSKPEITSLDELFIDKTIQYLEQNYENSNMNVDDIALGAGVSRSSFFKKIKSLTGLAPVDFVREFRLQKAVQIIEAGETNISQIAYDIGINDTRYFSKCFKQKYGMNPSEYISKKRT